MTKKTSKKDKFDSRKIQFLNRISSVYGELPSETEQRFSITRIQSAWLLDKMGPTDYPWMSLSTSKNASDPYIKQQARNNRAYIQNASSWIPVINLRPNAGDTILDVCAAPGGKSLLLYELSAGEAILTSNDASYDRTKKMQNLFRAYDANIVTIHSKAEQLQYNVEQLYSKILVDTPCSGEGMVAINDPRSLEQWSIANIKRLAQLSRKIIHSAWQLLEPGGELVYSTCTVSPEENELTIDKFIRTHEDAELLDIFIPEGVQTAQIVESWGGTTISDAVRQKTVRIKHQEYFEAFYVAKLRKKA